MPMRPVGLSRDLPTKRVMRASVDGEDIVVWRAVDGTIAAWDNRCPHRGMSLSHGFVRGNMLACLYHGWHYGASGRCNYIPAHPDLDPPETIHAVNHEVVEQGGLIWVSVKSGSRPVQDLPRFDPLRSLIVEADEATVNAASAATPFDGSVAKIRAHGVYEFEGISLSIVCNPQGQATQVTALCSPEAGTQTRRALSRWCETMRRVAEEEGEA